jgi:RNA polymerase sigma-70 factor, ECF subfamily
MSDAGHELAVERFRSYLLLLARLQLQGRYPGKLDASDLVQQTLFDAHRQREAFRGRTPAAMAAWLRRMLACNLADALRGLGRAKRDAGRERSLQMALDDSSARLETWLLADQSSPSQQAQRHEQMLRLSDAVAKLPDAQREALVLHYWEGEPLQAIAARLGRTVAAVAGLLQRGLKTLRAALAEAE